MNRKRKQSVVVVCVSVAVVCVTVVSLLLIFRPWQTEKAENSSLNLSEKEQRQLLLNAGMTDMQADAFLQVKMKVVMSDDMITRCTGSEAREGWFSVTTATDRGFSIYNNAHDISSVLMFTVTFKGDAIEKFIDYNGVKVIEDGIQASDYHPWTTKIIMDAERELEQASKRYAKEWYNTVFLELEPGDPDWLDIECKSVFDNKKEMETILFQDRAVRLDGNVLSIYYSLNIKPVGEKADEFDYQTSSRIYGHFEFIDNTIPKLTKIIFTDNSYEDYIINLV